MRINTPIPAAAANPLLRRALRLLLAQFPADVIGLTLADISERNARRAHAADRRRGIVSYLESVSVLVYVNNKG